MSKIENVLTYMFLGGALLFFGIGTAGHIISLKKEIKRYQEIHEDHETYHEYLVNELKISEERLKRYTNSYGEDLGAAD